MNWPSEGKSHFDYLPTTPATQVSFEVKMWCAGHSWRSRRGLGWVHRLGHRLRILRNQDPKPFGKGYVS